MMTWLLTWAQSQPTEAAIWLVTLVLAIVAIVCGVRLAQLEQEDWMAEGGMRR